MSNGQIVKDSLTFGVLLYVLDVLCSSREADLRISAAELLARMLSDRLSGPRCRLLLLKFVPPIFLDATRDSPQACVQMFDATNENPELIWNEETRAKVASTVRRMKEE